MDSNMLSKTAMQSGGEKERETNIDEYLADELLLNILVRLPFFLHGRARLVCRKWGHIIRCINTKYFQQHSTYGLVLSLRSIYWHPNSSYMIATKGGRIETSELMSNISMQTSCNGLTLQVHHDSAKVGAFSLYVIDPATNQSFRLPSVDSCKRHFYRYQCGIAYSAASMEYKVTLPSYDVSRQSAFLDIVTVGVDESWRRVAIPKFFPTHVFNSFLDLPVCSEGFLHWGRGRYCLTMNVETEMITMTEAPIPPYHDERYTCWYCYLSTGRYLTLLIGSRDLSWEVWEMKPAESGEWRKAMLPNIYLEARHPIGWVKYPEVLAFSSSDITNYIVYNLQTNEINTIDLPYSLYCYNIAFVDRISLARSSQDLDSLISYLLKLICS